MRIKKIISQDVVHAVDENQRDVIILGNMIGSNQLIGNEVNINQVVRILKADSDTEFSRLLELYSAVNRENLIYIEEALRLCESRLGQKLESELYSTLVDHISFALERLEKGINFKNKLLPDVKKYYPTEFKIAQEAVEILSDRKGFKIFEDEAGYIALHLANAKNELKIPIAETVTKILRNSIKTIEFSHGIKVDESSLSYRRFITHFKNGLKRGFAGNMLRGEDEIFFNLIKQNYPEIYQTANRIARYIYHQYSITLTENEVINLTVHINNLIASLKAD